MQITTEFGRILSCFHFYICSNGVPDIFALRLSDTDIHTLRHSTRKLGRGVAVLSYELAVEVVTWRMEGMCVMCFKVISFISSLDVWCPTWCR